MIPETITSLILRSNPLLLLLFVISVTCLAVVLDRAIFWIASALRYRPTPAEIYELSDAKRQLLIAQLRHNRRRHYTGDILLACLESEGDGGRIQQAVSEAANHMASKLDALDLIARIAPLVGILGTVVGMAMSFGEVGSMVAASPAAISGGISVALRTTAYGLIISITASVACAAFRWCVQRAMLRIGRVICGTQYLAKVHDC